MEDIHGRERRRDRQAERLIESSLAAEDKALIRKFVDYKIATGQGVGRQEKVLWVLRTIGERYLEGSTFSSLTKDDVVRVVSEIETETWSDWTKRDYKLLLKAFLLWAGKQEEVNWIKLKRLKSLPNELISEQDVQKMIDAALNLRDKALIAMLYEGGFRISELGTMKVKDLSFDRWGAIAMVNGKTGPRRVRLIWSLPYVAQWIDAHPLRQDRNAPLWMKVKHGMDGITYEDFRKLLQRIAVRAGVQVKVNPHNFRHSRSTHLASRLTESQMEEYLGWVQGSRMPSVYVHMSGRDLDADLLKMYGLEAESAKTTQMEILQCPYCKTVNVRGARVCMNCKRPIVLEEVMSLEEKAMGFFEDMMEMLESNPDLKERFRQRLEGRS